MSLTFETNDRFITSLLRTIHVDGEVSAEELKVLNGGADARIYRVTGADGFDPAQEFHFTLTRFMRLTDEFVELMQRATGRAHASGMNAACIEQVRRAIEYRLACVVTDYKATIEPL